MYIWNIKALKQDLQADTLGEKAKFVYMFITIMMYSILFELFSRMKSVEVSDLGWAVMAANIMIMTMGLIFMFRANGGSHGRDFLGKYFSISFVVGMRFIPLYIVAFGIIPVLAGVEDALGDSESFVLDNSETIINIINVLITALLYWRIYKHIGDIREDIEPTEIEVKKKSSWLFYVFAFLSCAPIVGLLAIGVYIGHSAPPSHVVTGAELSQDHTQMLRDHNVIDEQEEIAFFYSGGILSVLETGTILTEARVISYVQDSETKAVSIDAIAYSDIAELYLSDKGDGFFEDTVIDLYRAGDEYVLSVVVSAEKNGDESVIRMLTSKTGLELLDYEDSEGIAIYDELPVDDEVDENPESVEPQGEAIE